MKTAEKQNREMRDESSIPKLVDIPTAAKLLGIRERTLRNWIFYRKICSFRVGGKRMLSLQDIEDFLKRSRVEAREPGRWKIGMVE
jgi:excisionase family DNA binding protein